jgi:hypothetical protein
MILYPAIDIMDGKAVRLVEGRFEDATTYHDDPLEAAQSWVDAGARFLHVVDLDGARAGEPRSLDHLRRIVRGTGIPVQYGGGLRTLPAVREALRAGAERAIVGTAAFSDVDFLDDIVSAFGARIVVSVGVVVAAAGTLAYTRVGDDTSYRYLAIALLVVGLGIGSTVAPSMAAAFQAVTREETPRATSAINAIQRVAGAIGTALLAIVLQRAIAANISDFHGGIQGVVQLSGDPQTTARLADAFGTAFWVAAALIAAGLVPALLLPRRTEEAEQEAEDEAPPQARAA